jgi:hypothetical protein
VVTTFISSSQVLRPDYYLKFYKSDGSTFLRPEDNLCPELFDMYPDTLRIELYKNSNSNKLNPTRIGVLVSM